MKTSRFFLLAILMTWFLFSAGCGDNKLGEEEILWDAKPSVMIGGVLYGTTGRSATYRTEERPENGGHVDGEITSSVAGHEYPTENNQSNFGTGYYYRYGENYTVEVFSGSNWIIYEAYKDLVG